VLVGYYIRGIYKKKHLKNYQCHNILSYIVGEVVDQYHIDNCRSLNRSKNMMNSVNDMEKNMLFKSHMKPVQAI
jgi:hypothetical protein